MSPENNLNTSPTAPNIVSSGGDPLADAQARLALFRAACGSPEARTPGHTTLDIYRRLANLGFGEDVLLPDSTEPPQLSQ